MSETSNQAPRTLENSADPQTPGGGPRVFPDWDQNYRETPVERMPWFYDALDPDVEGAIAKHGLSGRALDLGTGPATQAICLAKQGFTVTASDLSPTAVEKGQIRAERAGVKVAFVQDDILASKLTGPFDVVLDRGCFHVLPPERRAEYAATVAAFLAPKGTLLLKTFSVLQPGEQGPHRFTPDQIREVFSPAFDVISIEETRYQGTLDPQPFALFNVLRRK